MKNLPITTYAYRELELDFKEWLALLGYAESSVYNLPLYAHEFFHWLEEEGIKQIKEITTAHLTRFVLQLKTRRSRTHADPISAGHINKYHQALVLLSKYVRQTGKGNFTVAIERLPQDRPLPEILTTAEVKELYQMTDSSVLGLRDKVMLDIFYSCGLRRNEGVQLDITDIDNKRSLLYVRQGKNYKERYVPLNETTLSHIQDYLNHSRPFLQKQQKISALFISDKGNRMQGQSLLVRLRKLTTQAKLTKDIGLHTLRHSIATHLLQSGMELKYIARFLGHQSLESTQIYTHVSVRSFNEGRCEV